MIIKKQNRNHKESRSGAVVVEFALIFPIILMFFFSSLIFLQAFMLRDAAQHCAFEGARKGMLYGATNEEIQEIVEDALEMQRVKGGVSFISDLTDDSQSTVVVGVQIPLNENMWAAAPFIPEPWKVYSEVELKREIQNSLGSGN